MPSTERLASCRLIFFDGHVRITKADNLLLAVFTGFNHELLIRTGGALWFVTSHFVFVDLLSHYEFTDLNTAKLITGVSVGVAELLTLCTDILHEPAAVAVTVTSYVVAVKPEAKVTKTMSVAAM